MQQTNNQTLSALLQEVVGQRYDAMALRLIRAGEPVPDQALRPWEQNGQHLALCQAFALARRGGQTVYMRKEDHWCWAPLIAFGAVECLADSDAFQKICEMIGIVDAAKARDFVANMPRLPLGQYEGILVAPLAKAAFAPDAVLINCSNAQLRTLLLGVKSQTGDVVESSFDPLDSCVWSIVPALQRGVYRITLPDPGDYARALTDENDIIFTVPACRLEELRAGLEWQRGRGMVHASFQMDMKNDFARPSFYNALYRQWGLAEGDVWQAERK